MADTYQLLLNRKKFLQTEFGRKLQDTVWRLDTFLCKKEKGRSRVVDALIAEEQAKMDVFLVAMKQFYGKEYVFLRNKKRYGIKEKNSREWLIREERVDGQQS